MIHKNQTGAAALEFVLVLPVLAALVFGIIEFGALFYNKQVLTNACREGARAGITGLTEEEIKNIVTNYCLDPDTSESKLIGLASPIEIETTDVQISKDGNDLKIWIVKNCKLLFWKVFSFENDGVTLSAETVMRMEI